MMNLLKIYLEKDGRVKNGVFKDWFSKKISNSDFTIYTFYKTKNNAEGEKIVFSFDVKHFNSTDLTEDELVSSCVDKLSSWGIEAMLKGTKTGAKVLDKGETFDIPDIKYKDSDLGLKLIPDEFYLNDTYTEILYKELKKKSIETVTEKVDRFDYALFRDCAEVYEATLSHHIENVKEYHADKIAITDDLSKIFSK